MTCGSAFQLGTASVVETPVSPDLQANGHPGAEHTLRAQMADTLGASKAQFFFDRMLDYFFNEDDVIFLRNVMIYFDLETKRQVVRRLLPFLRPDGYFIVSHSESLNGIADNLQMVRPSIYRKQ